MMIPTTIKQHFPQDFNIELLIPASSEFEVESYVQEASSSPLKARDILFFEEVLTVYILISGGVDEDQFRQLLQRIEVTVTANATSAAPPPRLQHSTTDHSNDRPTKIVLDSIVLKREEATHLVRSSDGMVHRYGALQADMYLRYPSVKFHRPVVHFTASAIVKPATCVASLASTDADYMPSILPETENLLGNLVQTIKPVSSTDLGLNLPASRLIKVAPRSSSTSDDVRPLRTSSRLISILPILVVRLASTAATRMPEPMASLDIELTRHANCCIEIEDINIRVSSMRAECLTGDLQSSLLLYPGDRSSLMYKFFDTNIQPFSHQSDQPLEVEILAVARLTEACRPRLKAQWSGSVLPFLNKGLHHWRRPVSSSYLLSQEVISSRPVSKHLSMTGRPQSMLGSDLGVTFAFNGPKSVKIGETFFLDVFIVNRSTRRKRLAIVAVPQSSKSLQTSTAGIRPFSTASSAQTASHETAEAIADSKTLFNLQNQRLHHAAEVICLNADVRIGPLPPGTCHNVQLEFLALSKGFVGISSIHIVDLESKETTEVTDLPDIVVLDAATESADI